jgi:chromate transporter
VPATPPARAGRGELASLAGVFLRLGVTSFGGPAAHVALMRDEFVRRRGWLDDAAYLDLIGAANLIPGPTSTEVAMHVGHRRAGWPGLVVAGLAFLAPAVLIVAVLAWIYVRAGTRPEIEALLTGIAPVVVAIIAFAGASIGRTVVRTRTGVVLSVVAVILLVVRVPEIVVLLGLGVVGLVARAGPWTRLGRGADPGGTAAIAPIVLASIARDGGGHRGASWPASAAAIAIVTVTPVAIFLEFAKIGAVLFGSGYVLVSLLRSELVEGLGWITENQLIDAVAVGQATPGPLFSTATFIGYLVDGPIGATVATVGIFLPAFIAVAVSIPILDRLRSSRRARAFLDRVNAASVGLLAVVAVQLAVGSLLDILGVATMVAAFALLWRGVGTGWLIAGGAAIGLIRLAVVPG